MKICTACGYTSVNDRAAFCSKCASKMDDYEEYSDDTQENGYVETQFPSQSLWDRETIKFSVPGGRLSIGMGIIVIIIAVIIINSTSNQAGKYYQGSGNYNSDYNNPSQTLPTPASTEDASLTDGNLSSQSSNISAYIQNDDGSYYEGEVKNGEPHGFGTITYPENDERNRVVYTGEFRNGVRHGFGTIIWSGGERYEGKWVDDVMYEGLLKYAEDDAADRVSYEGEFTNGIIHGWGIMIWSDGTVYEGGWNSNSKFDGYGIYTMPDGTRYEGEFKDDKRHGYGVQTQPSFFGTRTFDGIWENDKFIG